MSMVRANNFLYLIWKDPQTRNNYIVGKLCKGKNYTFEYCGEYGKAESCGWSKLESFPEEILYENDTLFPVFSSRLPDKKRRDIKKILDKYELSEFDDFELLRKSEGRLPIDTYSFVDPIFPEDEIIQRDFYIMGIRHNSSCMGRDCSRLPQVNKGDELCFDLEPDNKYDPNAIRILTSRGDLLGYVPRYYSQPILQRIRDQISYICNVIDINSTQDCSECIKVRLKMPRP